MAEKKWTIGAIVIAGALFVVTARFLSPKGGKSDPSLFRKGGLKTPLFILEYLSGEYYVVSKVSQVLKPLLESFLHQIRKVKQIYQAFDRRVICLGMAEYLPGFGIFAGTFLGIYHHTPYSSLTQGNRAPAFVPYMLICTMYIAAGFFAGAKALQKVERKLQIPQSGS